jgi:hypothetical protein
LECLKYRQLIKLAIRTGLCEDVLGFQRLRRKLVGASPGALRALLRLMARIKGNGGRCTKVEQLQQ